LNNAVIVSEFGHGYAVMPAVKSYASSIFNKDAHKSIVAKKMNSVFKIFNHDVQGYIHFKNIYNPLQNSRCQIDEIQEISY
jgi:hypothetical protein